MTQPPSAELTDQKHRYAAARCVVRLREICNNGTTDATTERLRRIDELAEALFGPDADLERIGDTR